MKIKHKTKEINTDRLSDQIIEDNIDSIRELIFNDLISPQFTIIYEAIRNGNKLSKYAHRSVRPEMENSSNETKNKSILKFITRASLYPNSVEAMAYKICEKHYRNICTDNITLLKEIYSSSFKASFMGVTHATKDNLIFEKAPKNSRRAKIFDTIKKFEESVNKATISLD